MQISLLVSMLLLIYISLIKIKQILLVKSLPQLLSIHSFQNIKIAS
jgi:hypothetical protein